MSEGLLEMRGDCELSQFWPDGASDADTIQLLMHVRGASFKFRKDAASAFKATHVFEGARVRGRVTKEVIDKNGHVSAAEIAALMRASREARAARAGVWGFLADTLRRVSIRRTFRGKGAPMRPDEGVVVLPKLFRRLAMWRVNRRAKMYSGALGGYLSQKRIVCFETRDFLAQGVAAMPRDFADFIGRDGRILAGLEELVFKEDPSELLVAGGGQAKW